MAAPAPGRRRRGDNGTRRRLEVRGISLSFGGNNALDEVSLHADHGEVVGIIGPNGAGKTTLFDVISGFLHPDAGRVELGGRRRHRPHGLGPRPARPGPLLPGLAALRRADGPRRAGRLARALHRRRRPLQRHAAAAAPGPDRGRRHGAGRRAPRPVRPRRASPTTWSASCPPAPGGSSTWPPWWPTSRPSSSSTSRRRAWPSARSRPWSACSATCATGSTPPCSSSSTTSPSLPSWPTAWWPWTAAPCSSAGRRATSSSRPWWARPSSAPTRSPSRARAPRPRSTITEVDRA